jgi:hypothetical protein
VLIWQQHFTAPETMFAVTDGDDIKQTMNAPA